jgi:hypothetical protein
MVALGLLAVSLVGGASWALFNEASRNKGIQQGKRLQDADIIQIAVQQGGQLSTAGLSLHGRIPVEEATEKLERLAGEGIFYPEANADGGISYRITDNSLLKQLPKGR